MLRKIALNAYRIKTPNTARNAVQKRFQSDEAWTAPYPRPKIPDDGNVPVSYWAPTVWVAGVAVYCYEQIYCD